MKVNSTVVLTLFLLTMMLGSGFASAFIGFTMGSSALKGVSSPDSRPTTKYTSNDNKAPQVKVSFLNEKEIIKNTKARIQANKPGKKSNNQKAQNQIKKPQNQQKKQKLAEEKLEPGFPIVSESEGVFMSVRSTRYSGGDLLMRVRMENKSDETVRFLYSFLDVTDDKGRTLSAITEGLPAELPTNGTIFTGTIRVPKALLEGVGSISLTLTDYPGQKLKLQVSDIPVEK